MQWNVSILLVVLMTFGSMAGCVGSTEAVPGPASATTIEPSASAGSFDETTGALSGTVTDDELVPVPGAEIALMKTDFKTTSAKDGTFSLSSLPPGEYTLLAAALGYESTSLKVAVVAGTIASGVHVRLAGLAVVETHVELYPFKGLISCSIGMFGVLSEECGQGIQTSGNGNIGQNPNNKIDWKFNVTNKENLVDIFLELNWKPGSAAAQQLAFNVAHGFKCTPGCGATKTYCDAFSVYGRPVQHCEIDEDTIAAMKVPWDITARAWAAPVGPTEVPNIVIDQAFEMYRTEFFGEPKPEVYSAIQDH